MRAEDIVILQGETLDMLARDLVAAVQEGRRVRFTVEDGLKWDSGYGWTPGYGSPADATGQYPVARVPSPAPAVASPAAGGDFPVT